MRRFMVIRDGRHVFGAFRDLPPSFLWGMNAALMVAMIVWALADPHFEATVESSLTSVAVILDDSHTGTGTSAMLANWQAVVFAVLSLTIVASLLRMAVGLFGRNKQFRTLRALLMFTAITGGWLALGVQSAEIAWQGKRLRLRGHLAEFESFARRLRSDWPSRDGESRDLGPYMGYPIGHPTLLILLTPPTISDSGTSVCAVERTPAGGLLFQLSGAETGGWVEWHPESEQPASFVGSLGDTYELADSLPLGGGWHLVRYGRS